MHSPGPSPSPPAPARARSVRAALAYLEAIKLAFRADPGVYDRFLEVMQAFQADETATTAQDVIERTVLLFRGHSALIQALDTFLPDGFGLELLPDEQGETRAIRVTTRAGQYMLSPGGELLPKL
ncbi:hypothetical protein CALCODRAFT_478949 [Calocera cornea HHB12733]|uniref:PAH2 domain-containing protein n=1 Tax=Calocera cornea HHB12733 TaxID=1353952 RepID=A0A165K443_9BASI|nr:hypothetical protein CALCODRAFT_478949 [Calocera cornea HHB12733]